MKRTEFNKDNINDIMLLNGLNVTEFARKIGTSRQLVQSWIEGNSIPGIRSLLKMVDAFDLPIDYFFVQNDVRVHRIVKGV